MNESVLVSVVIPVYNVERYIKYCVDSVLRQTYQRLDIILIDDGSTDKSGHICDEFAVLDARVRVFHKENGGLSDARNFGLERAYGEWVCFIDSDDFVSPIFIEALLTAALDSKSAIAAIPGGCSFFVQDKVDLITNLNKLDKPKILSTIEVQQQMLYQKLGAETQYRICKIRGMNAIPLLSDNPFPVGYLYEDLATTYKIIHAAGNRIAVVNSNQLYAYRLRSDSIMGQEYSPHKADSSIAVSRWLYSDICKWYPALKPAAASRCFSVNRMVYAQVPSNQHYEKMRLWNELIRYRRTVVMDPRARLRERIAAIMACLGQRPFCAFCRFCRSVGLMR